MGFVKWLIFLLKHPLDFNTFVQFYLYYHRKLRNSAWKEHPNSGWDRRTMRKCWELFDMTDKAACTIVKGLDGDLARTVALFTVALRGLDTIEDDMTLLDAVKQPLLRSFHSYILTPGWKFEGSGPNEKHRQLLVEYDNVVAEVNLLSPEYKNIIIGTALKMGNGMADYAHKAATTGSIRIETVAEYDQYCHYAGGLAVQGLSHIFSASGMESRPQLELSNSVGLFIQKTDIIGDYREDVDQQRYFWPREIWGREEYGFKDMTEMYKTDPDTVRRATYVQSAMALDALQHVIDVLDCLRLVRNQTLFNVSAIMAVMTIADLGLFFMNKEIFQRNIEVRKADIAKLIMRSTNIREVAIIFREYARKIHAKTDRSDPNLIHISIVCSKIDEYCAQYCVEQFSTTKISMSEFMMYGSAAFLLILLLSLSRVEVH